MNYEFKTLLILTFALLVLLAGVVLRTKVFSISTLNKIFYHIECNPVPYKDGKTLCLGKDAGFKSDYATAEAYCSKLNLKLPSREEAKYIWEASENCQRMIASNQLEEAKQAVCNNSSVIKFSKALQYYNGSFWLRDAGNGKLHYAINYYDGSINIYKDSLESLGVRCVGIK